MKLTAQCTRWLGETEHFALEGESCATTWMPLDVALPADAQPFVCYLDSVIFSLAGVEAGRATFPDLLTTRHLLWLKHRWWEVSSAMVIYLDSRW